MSVPLERLLAAIDRAGVELAVRDGRLRYRPKARVTPDLLAGLRAHRAALLALPWCGACGQRLRLPETAAEGLCLRCMDAEAFTRAIAAAAARRRRATEQERRAA
ncbi:MAG: hypothetical protein IRY92_00455 [Dactylosporangium sp.]|nr:hypothetical protein [Dactylosporangium sp.]